MSFFATKGDVSPDTEPLEAAIHSIFGFIERTAERTDTGITWETINYKNEPHHSISVFNGVGGISFFLVDYYRRYGNPVALELSQGAIDWCTNLQGEHFKRGLHFGQTGVAAAALHRAVALHEPTPEVAIANAKVILAGPPGPITDLIGGEASNGFYLLKLWQHTGDTTYLQGAERCAIWLEQQLVRDEHGTHCLIDPQNSMNGFPDKIFLGVAHGVSGVAHFLTYLAEETHNERWANLARDIFATVTRYARQSMGGLNWPNRIDTEELTRCQWSHGAAGIGLTYLNAHRVLGDPETLETAIQAAEATYGYGDYRNNYTQCTGLAGGGELLLEVYRATGDSKWKDRAVDFAHQCIAYREMTPEGDAWPTDAKGLYSADFDYGASGVGHFLLRVCYDGKIPMPLM
uniref:lanthionine synthetase LanC family protein n=1 Tax=Cephaloticoccus sp. TaxID=1985742 RepID=UPI0040494DD8